MGTLIIKLKYSVLKGGILLLLTGCTSYKPAYLKQLNESGKKEYKSKKIFFKEYALCSCLQQRAAKDSTVMPDASGSVYYDLSDDDLLLNNNGKKIDSNAHAYILRRANQSGRTYENRKTPVFNCITYFKSRELDIFTRTLLNNMKKVK
jgi:hypothetical protein